MMNEQEMQFADPDWKPTGPLSTQSGNTVVNAPTPVSVTGSVSNQAYDAQPLASLPAYDQGYQGGWQQEQFAGQPFSPQSPAQQSAYRPAGAMRGRGHSRWWIWAIVVIVVLAMVSPMSHSFQGGNAGYHSSFSAPAQVQKQVYSLQGATELDINDLAGNVIVQTVNNGNQNVVVATGDGSQPQVYYQGQSMVFTTNDSDDITVFIPQNVALKLSAGTNDIEVDNFSAQLTAQTNSGNIMLTNDTLSQGSSLNTNSGNIEQDQGSASDTTVISSTGQITLNQVDLSGQVTVSTGGNGTISYTGGTLDPQGKYQFTTDSGDIDLTLPQNTSMQMKISQKGGHYNSDFTNSTGSAPQASIGISTNSGNITINKQEQ